MVDKVNLHISTLESSTLDDATTFFIHPKSLALLHTFKDCIFESCLIYLTPIDILTSLHFSYLTRILKPDAKCKIIINQPVTVMQDYDYKQVESCAILGGFIQFEKSKDTLKDPKSGRVFNTISVNCVRPQRLKKRLEISTSTTSITENVRAKTTSPIGKKLTNDKVSGKSPVPATNSKDSKAPAKIEVETKGKAKIK